ncbi:DUF6263 family protein [Planctomycetota bacterium]
MPRIYRTALFSVGIVLAAFSSVHAQKKMQWHFEKGQQRESEIVQQITQVVNGETLGSTATLYVSSMVDEVNDDGSAIVTKKITRITMSIAMPSYATIDYDSATGEDGRGSVKMFADAISPAIGKSVKMKITPTGKVTDIERLDTPAKKKQASTISSPMFSPMVRDGQFDQLLAKSILKFPENELKEGDRWNFNGKSVLGKMPLASETFYIFRGTQEENGQQFDRFDVQTSVNIKTPATDNAVADATTTPKITISEQRSTGEILFDSKTSVVVRSKVEQVLTLAFPMAGGEVKSDLTFVTSQKTSIVETAVPEDDQTDVVENKEPATE